jgi:hypothetical protein
MGMRRLASIRFIAGLLLATVLLLVGFAADDCQTDPVDGRLVCDVSGKEPTEDPPPTGEKTKNPTDRPPIRYLYSTGECYYWSTIPGGVDAWDPANENTVYGIVLGTPECDPTVTDPLPDRAWRIFRSFPLATPDPSFQPANHGITGHPTYLAAANPTSITHSEVLPDDRLFEVRAQVASLTVDWGDEWTTTEDPSVALPYPAGAVTHTYTTKTCPPDYRITHPSGPNCHPTLEAYPVIATFTWWGEYRIGGSWIPIGTLDLTTTILYDVDEVIGVLVDP